MATDLLEVNTEQPQPEVIERAAAAVRRGRVVAIPTDALYTLVADPFNLRAVSGVFYAKGREIHRSLPLLVGDPDFVTLPGVVASVGPEQRETGRLCGELAAKVLKGASPAHLPVQHPPFELIVNLKAAVDVGLEVPEPALKHAARVIR